MDLVSQSDGSAERVRFTGDGNVLIGRTSDVTSQKLQVNGYIDITDVTSTALRWYDGSTFRGGLGLDDWATSGAANDITLYGTRHLFFVAGGGNNKRMTIDSNGLVGIGTTSPSHMLDITTSRSGNGQGSTIRINRPDNSSYENAINWATNGTSKWFLGCLLYTSPSPRDRQKSRMPSSA